MQLDLLYVGTLPPHPGGSAVSCLQIIDELSQAGHRVRAIAPVTTETRSDANRIANEFPNIEFTRFELPYYQIVSDLPPVEDYRKRKGDQIRSIVQRLVEEKRPDVMIVGRESFALYVPEIARRMDIACIVRAAGGATNGILTATYPRPSARELLEQMCIADVIVSPAEHLATSLRSLGCASVVAIPNMVDLNRFSPGPKPHHLAEQLGLEPDDIIAVHVSNLKPVKRPLDIIDSAAIALRDEPRLRYLIVGDGPLRGEMEQRCKHHGIGDRVRFAGWIPQQRIPEYFRLADMVIMASEAEGLARVYLESQASGRLLVSSDIPAAREVIRDGETGLLFSVGDSDDLARQTVRAAMQPELRNQIAIQARQRVRLHAPDKIVTEYCRVLEQVVRRRNDSSRSAARPA